MSNAPSHFRTQRSWRELVEIAVFETDVDNLSQRLQDAEDAIMEEIEDSFQTASSGECQSLTNAMNSVRELRRVSEKSGWKNEKTHSRRAA